MYIYIYIYIFIYICYSGNKVNFMLIWQKSLCQYTEIDKKVLAFFGSMPERLSKSIN